MRRLPASLALALLAGAGLSACAPAPVVDPTIGMHISKDGTVYPSVSGTTGNVTIGAGSGGGWLGTSFGPVRLSAGF